MSVGPLIRVIKAVECAIRITEARELVPSFERAILAPLEFIADRRTRSIVASSLGLRLM